MAGHSIQIGGSCLGHLLPQGLPLQLVALAFHFSASPGGALRHAMVRRVNHVQHRKLGRLLGSLGNPWPPDMARNQAPSDAQEQPSCWKHRSQAEAQPG